MFFCLAPHFLQSSNLQPDSFFLWMQEFKVKACEIIFRILVNSSKLVLGSAQPKLQILLGVYYIIKKETFQLTCLKDQARRKISINNYALSTNIIVYWLQPKLCYWMYHIETSIASNRKCHQSLDVICVSQLFMENTSQIT